MSVPAVDSTGQTIDLLLTAKRDSAAKRFFLRAIEASGNPMPRAMNVDKNPVYPAALEALKAEGARPRRGALRQCKYLNNIIEQDHRTVKQRVWLARLAKGYGSFQSAWRTLQGIEAVNMIRRGRVKWPVKPTSSRCAAASFSSFVNSLQETLMIHFSVRWILSPNCLSQFWGQVQLIILNSPVWLSSKSLLDPSGAP